jgi:hypothetical protein
MKRGWQVAAWALGIQAVFVLPLFLGAIYRGEQSLAAWEQYEVEIARHGLGNGVVVVYLYLIFYSTLVALPYAVLGLRYTSESPDARGYLRAGRFMIRLWLAVTFILFAPSTFAFIRNVPSDIWNGWLLILWLGSAAFFGSLVLVLERRLRKTRSGQ